MLLAVAPCAAAQEPASTQPPPSLSADAYAPITGAGRLHWIVDGTIGPRSLGIGVVADLFQTGINTPEEWGRTPSGMGKRLSRARSGRRDFEHDRSRARRAVGRGSTLHPVRPARQSAPAWHYALKTAVLAQRRDGRLAPAWGRYAGNIFTTSLRTRGCRPVRPRQRRRRSGAPQASAAESSETSGKSSGRTCGNISGSSSSVYNTCMKQRSAGRVAALACAILLGSALLHAQTPHAVVVDQNRSPVAGCPHRRLSGRENHPERHHRRGRHVRSRARRTKRHDRGGARRIRNHQGAARPGEPDRAADRARERGHGSRRLRAHLVPAPRWSTWAARCPPRSRSACRRRGRTSCSRCRCCRQSSADATDCSASAARGRTNRACGSTASTSPIP